MKNLSTWILLITALTIGTAAAYAAVVPLLLSPANDPFVMHSELMPHGFVRIVNQSDQSGTVRILAIDDAGNRAAPANMPFRAREARHFNIYDLEDGGDRAEARGLNKEGVGRPAKGHWRLDVETDLDVRVLAYIRTNDGFLTAMHDVLPRDAQGRLVVQFFNPATNYNSETRLRLINTGENAETVSIEGFDDRGRSGEQVTVTLAAGEACTLIAGNLEGGGTRIDHQEIGGCDFAGGFGFDGSGKWHLFITAGQSVVGMSLMYQTTYTGLGGYITNLSTSGSTP